MNDQQQMMHWEELEARLAEQVEKLEPIELNILDIDDPEH